MNNHFRVAKTSQRRHLGFKFEAMWMRHAEIEEAIEKKNSKFAKALYQFRMEFGYLSFNYYYFNMINTNYK